MVPEKPEVVANAKKVAPQTLIWSISASAPKTDLDRERRDVAE